MGILYFRLLIILNEEDSESTYYHIAVVMLRHFKQLNEYSIIQLAELCDVSKSTISKFIRYIGYEDFSDFRYATLLQENKYGNLVNYETNVMNFIERNSLDTYMLTVQADILATYQSLDWNAIDMLVEDLMNYERVGAFGLMFSETAALDLQLKLSYNKKFIVTNLNDIKQEKFIQEAGEDTLLIIFSDSGHFLDKYRNIHDFANKGAFNKTMAKVVLITSNPEMKNDPRVSYCVSYKKTRSMNTHRIVYGVLTDIIAYKFRETMKKSGKL